MKILLLLVAQSPGGAEKRFYNYSKYILNNGDNSYYVIISRYLQNSLGEIVYNNNRLLLYGLSWKKCNKLKRFIDYISLIILLLRLIHIKFDVVHYITPISLFFRRLVRSSNNITSFFNSLTHEQNEILIKKSFNKIMRQKFKIDCLDERIAEKVLEYYPDNASNIFVSPCSFIDYSDTDADFKQKENIISFVGRLEDVKGIPLLIKIIPEIVKNTNFDIHIYGTGSYYNKIREYIQSAKIEDRVKLGYIINPKTELKRSKIFLSLQYYENYPSQSLLEAMACGNAIIATDVGLTKNIIKQDFGVLVSIKGVLASFDSDGLLPEILELTSSSDRLLDMGMKAREFALLNHNIDRFYIYLKGLYSL